MRLSLFLAVFAAVLPLGAALANDRPEIVIPDVTELDFDEVDVHATLQRPSSTLVAEARRPSFHPLIRLRSTFDPEMHASVFEL